MYTFRYMSNNNLSYLCPIPSKSEDLQFTFGNVDVGTLLQVMTCHKYKLINKFTRLLKTSDSLCRAGNFPASPRIAVVWGGDILAGNIPA